MWCEDDEFLVEGLIVNWYARNAPPGPFTLGEGVTYIYRKNELAELWPLVTPSVTWPVIKFPLG